jgi:hypothetical protein
MLASEIIHQSQTWEQFCSLVTALPTTKAKGDAFEGLCAAFLRTDPRYVADLKTVWLRHDLRFGVPALWSCVGAYIGRKGGRILIEILAVTVPQVGTH